ncbi:uncharacterized protein DUF4229 [Murinocardiopsis flavida]|uniref:Uncharacterized protein DUF4229 n=1 Tax=Murinocardiopsis flavida TaxID=645275 RepID=A0A2P8D6G4_9ACTN|nr:DUF4229 domain-containing protein [Murinocardiopsis flavida]PSK92815.1 uncharacterized protein DUF4229 [Murinocardiopsis flavida]
MRSVFAYTASRLLLFAIAYGIVVLLGGRSLFAIVVAFLASGLVSYFVLSAQRDAMSAAVASGIDRMRGVGSRLEAGAAQEDDAADSVRAQAAAQDRDGATEEPADDPDPVAAAPAPGDGDRDPAATSGQH